MANSPVSTHPETSLTYKPETKIAFITLFFLAINLTVYAIMVVSGVSVSWPAAKDAVRWGALYGPLISKGQPWRLVSSLFVHFGFVHLFCNMWNLFVAGRLVEFAFGSFAFFAIYVISGIVGNIAELHYHPVAAVAGASGAIFGIVGALAGFILIRRDKIKDPRVSQTRMPILFFIFINLLPTNDPHIGVAGHVGGLLAGALMGVLTAVFRSEARVHESHLENYILVYKTRFQRRRDCVSQLLEAQGISLLIEDGFLRNSRYLICVPQSDFAKARNILNGHWAEIAAAGGSVWKFDRLIIALAISAIFYAALMYFTAFRK